MDQLPIDIQRDWMAELHKTQPTSTGVYRLIAARRTAPKGYESQRVTVLILDENGIAMPGIDVAFSYSTANVYFLTGEWQWTPPSPHRAFIVPTGGNGQIDQVQGSGVKQGEPGGITVYIFEPEYSSDVVTGAGMLADHTGLHLTYQRQRTGVKSTADRIAALEHWVTNFDERLKSLENA